jgi:hypothetical protein
MRKMFARHAKGPIEAQLLAVGQITSLAFNIIDSFAQYYEWRSIVQMCYD